MGMYAMSMHEDAWECMRMPHIHGGVCGSFNAELQYTTCLIMNGNACAVCECLISMEGRMSFHAHLHYTTCMRMNWDCIRLCHNGWTCMWWECMRMTENVWECLIFKGCVGRLRRTRIIRHAWWMYQNDSYSGDGRVIQHWFTLDGSPNMTHAPTTPMHSYDDTPILL